MEASEGCPHCLAPAIGAWPHNVGKSRGYGQVRLALVWHRATDGPKPALTSTWQVQKKPAKERQVYNVPEKPGSKVRAAFN